MTKKYIFALSCSFIWGPQNIFHFKAITQRYLNPLLVVSNNTSPRYDDKYNNNNIITLLYKRKNYKNNDGGGGGGREVDVFPAHRVRRPLRDGVNAKRRRRVVYREKNDRCVCVIT